MNRMNYIDSDDSEYLQEMRIILLGRTGGGKSTVKNSICGSWKINFPFPSDISSSSITHTPNIAYRVYGDRKLCVIDTPGLFDMNRSNDETMKQLNIAFRLAKSGPHAFLIVLSGRCTKEETNVLNLLKKKFGEYFLDYCFIIITREDEIQYNYFQPSDYEVIQKYFQESPQILQEFRIKCNNRCFIINNRASFEECERKIDTIIQAIKYNEDHHANSFFNQEMFDLAERYNQEWNNEQFYRQQADIEEEFAEIYFRKYLCNADSRFLEEQQLIIDDFHVKKQVPDAKTDGLDKKLAAKAMDAIKSTDK